ncbi:MAG TPA: hypothetical protein ENN17_01080 [bacterium]|nr:hypothetical protein [bacterium]
MQIKRNGYLAGWIVAVISMSPLHAQTVGNPLGVRGHGEWTVSASVNYTEQQTANQTAIIRRQAFKVMRGMTPRLDMYVTAGRAQLCLSPPSSRLSGYRDKYRFLYGAGLTAVLKPETPHSPYQIWFGAQGLRFRSEGTYDFDLSEGGGETLVWQKSVAYDWREGQAVLGMSYPVHHNIRLYLGGVAWVLQRIDTQRELWSDSWSKPHQSTFQSGMWTGGIFGVELLLPKQYSIGCEVLVFNEKNFQIMAGICQTGE